MLRTCSLVASAFSFAVVLPAQIVPTGFQVDTLLSTGLGDSNDLCFLPDGRVLIADSNGLVTVYAEITGSSAAIGTVPSVESGGERGLLSIAADPAFATNGCFYVYYSSLADNFMHLDRFTCTGDLGNPASTNLTFANTSRCVVLGAIPDVAGNHNGGSVRFGPDGKLYVTIGDDANSCSAQSLTSQAGCLLRLDTSTLPIGGSTVAPSYGSLDPGNNPNSAATDFSQLVIANGLRNPYRMEIDPATGNVYIGDVGAGSEEEYTEYLWSATALPLVNFGWPWREGAIAGFGCGGTQPTGLVPPLASVSHGGGWAAVMGGACYRNQGPFAFGTAYEGNTFFLDFYAGELRRLVKTTTWGPAAPVPGQPSATNWGTGFGNVTSFRLGPDGAIWMTVRPGVGALKRVRPSGPINTIAVAAGDRQVGTWGDPLAAPLVVEVRDPQGALLPNATVAFLPPAGVQLSTTNPLLTDATGRAMTNVVAAGPAAFTVLATTPGGQSNATFGLFGRRLLALTAGNLLVLSMQSDTNAVPATVPHIVFLSLPGSPVLPTWFGPLCTDPTWPGTFAIEDSVGVYGGISLSGTGAMGSPGFVKVYALPPGLLSGLLINFQVVGIDPIDGFFRSNCATKQF